MFRPVQILFAVSYVLSLEVGVVHFVHQAGRYHQRKEPVIRIGCLKKLLRRIFFGTYGAEEFSTEWNDCVQREEGMQDRYPLKKCP